MAAKYSYFKTSYVTVYPKKPDCFPFPFQNFKTSYVTVYRGQKFPRMSFEKISKHRMLLFIRDPALLKLREKNFKTSYVTVYLLCGFREREES